MGLLTTYKTCIKLLKHAEKKLMMSYLNACDQARNQLGIPEGAKSFPTGAQIFWTMSNICKLCPTHFSRGAKNFLGGFAPLRPPCLRVCLWHHSCQFKLKKISVVFLTCTCAPHFEKGSFTSGFHRLNSSLDKSYFIINKRIYNKTCQTTVLLRLRTET